MLGKNTCQTYIKCIFHFRVNDNIKEKGIKKTKQQQQLTKCQRGKIKFYIRFSAAAAITFSKIHSQTLNLTAHRGSLLVSFSAIAVALIASLGLCFFSPLPISLHTHLILSFHVLCSIGCALCKKVSIFLWLYKYAFNYINGGIVHLITVKGAKPIVVFEVQGGKTKEISDWWLWQHLA